MPAQILVATSQSAFGELLRLSLEESGRYSVRLAQTSSEAISAAQRLPFQLAILDAALPGLPLPALARELQNALPALPLVLIDQPGGETEPLEGIRPQAVFTPPFYMPDLLESIGGLIPETPAAFTPLAKAVKPPAPLLTALLSQAELSEALTARLSNAGMVAAAVFSSSELRASAGRLDQAALEGLGRQLGGLLGEDSSAGLVRYVHPAPGHEYLAQASRLAPGWMLLVVCESGTGLSRLRTQASRLSQSLREALAAHTPPPEIPPAILPPTPSGASSPTLESPLSTVTASPPLDSPLPVIDSSLPTLDSPFSTLESSELEIAQAPQTPETANLLEALRAAEEPEEAPEETSAEISLSDLLAAMPAPDPGAAGGQEWVPERDQTPADGFLFPWEMEAAARSKTGQTGETPPTPPVDSTPLPVESPGLRPVEPAALPEDFPAPQALEPILVTEEISVPQTLPPAEAAIAEIPPAGQAMPPILPEIPPVTPAMEKPSVQETTPASPPSQEPNTPAESQTPAEVSAPTPDWLAETRPIRRYPQRPSDESTAETVRIRPKQPATGIPAPLPSSPEPTPTEAIRETRPNPFAAPEKSQDAEPPLLEFTGLSYTGVLVPRLPHHRMVGPLAESLAEWLPQICLAYGWRLEWQSMQPDCFQWAVHVSPSISPGIVVRLIRQISSQRIFERYAGLTKDNPSGDFWAPGYLIISGKDVPESRVIEGYVRQTRNRQGIGI